MFEIIPYPAFWVAYFAIGLVVACLIFRRFADEVKIYRDPVLWLGFAALSVGSIFGWPAVIPGLWKA